MIALDTNVLVNAHRAEAPDHAVALALLNSLAGGDRPWALPVFCIGEFLRVVTHPRVFNPPTTLDAACGAIEQLLATPMVRLLRPGTAFADHLFRLARRADAKGNLVYDAQIAAVCREHGVDQIASFDRDFLRFPDLRLRDPRSF